MAEEKVEKKEAAETEKEKAPSTLPKMALIAVIALVSSIGGGVVSSYVISKTLMKAEAKAAEPEKKVDEVEKAIEKGAAIPLEPFVVNLADTDAARYLRIKISLMIDDNAKLKELTENSALQLKLRDVILQSLTDKKSSDLMNEEGKKKLREEIQGKVTGYFKKPKLVDVMFTEFVIQL